MSTGPRSQRDFAIVLGLLLLAASLLTASAFTVWRMRNAALNGGVVTAATHVRNFEEHLTQILHLINVTAANVDLGTVASADGGDVGQSLALTIRPLPFVRSLSVIDGSGLVLASSNLANVGAKIDVGNFFPPDTGATPVLRVGGPWRGRDFSNAQPASDSDAVRSDEASFFPLLFGADAAKGARLTVSINPDYFIQHWTQLLGEDVGHVQLLRYDDVLLSSSMAGESPGRLQQAGEVGTRLHQVEHGEFDQVLPNGRRVITAYRASSRFPVVLAVHVDQERLLADWRVESRWIGTIVVPISLALMAAAWLLWRHHQRILAQQREIDRERRLTAGVFDASSVAIMISDPTGKIITVNAAFERDTGYLVSEVVGKTPRVLNSGLNPPEIYSDLWATITRGFPWRGELQNKRKSGEVYWESLVISPVLGDEGRITHFVASMEDISKKKRYELELREAKEAAESASKAKSQFLANMSHEIRTPLNGILGMAQLILMDDGANAGQWKDYARTIHQSGNVLLTLLNDILDLSKVESGKIELVNARFDPKQLIDRTAGLFSQAAHEKCLRLEAEWKGAVGSRYEGDAVRLQQMLSNLIGNAIKFTHRGFVRVEGVVIEEEEHSAVLEFSVMDSGIGVSAEQKAKLFNPFVQADSSTTRQYGGTGLGLSIIRSLAQLMEGSVGVDSELGQGSRFWFRVRVRRGGELADERQEPRAKPFTQQGQAGTMDASVLLVEDNAINRMLAEALLKKEGLRAVSVENGQEALDALRAGLSPSLILMDMQMPVMDGLTATRHIRAWEQEGGRARLPIVALTANAYEDDRRSCEEAGMDDFLTKPINLSALKEVLARWCEPPSA